MIVRNHRIIAQPWQIKAAERGELETIILPVTGYWSAGDPVSCPPIDKLSVGFKEGDPVFLAEEWCKKDWGALFDDDIYFTKSTTPESELIDWQPAETMPQTASVHRFEIRVVEIVQLSHFVYKGKGLYSSKISKRPRIFRTGRDRSVRQEARCLEAEHYATYQSITQLTVE
jgi:hypothetical protein